MDHQLAQLSTLAELIACSSGSYRGRKEVRTEEEDRDFNLCNRPGLLLFAGGGGGGRLKEWLKEEMKERIKCVKVTRVFSTVGTALFTNTEIHRL